MEQMSGARRSGRLLARFEEVAWDKVGRMPLTQPEREAEDTVEGTPREEDSVEAEESRVDEEAEVTKAGVDPQMSPKVCRTPSLSRSPRPREELVWSRRRKCHHRHLNRTWPT
jgi:hypothetical protein